MTEAKPTALGRVKFLLTVTLVVGLIGVIAFLLGKLNEHSYYLVHEGRELVVHQGAPIPFLTRPFTPRTDSERIAYAPLRVHPNWEGPSRQRFADRAALDQGISLLLQARLRGEFYGGRLPNMKLIAADMQRIDNLTGLGDEDRRAVLELKGDYAYLRAREMIDGMPARLEEARRLVDLAEQQGTGRLGDPRQLSLRLTQWMQLIAKSPVAHPLPPPTTTGENEAPEPVPMPAVLAEPDPLDAPSPPSTLDDTFPPPAEPGTLVPGN